VLSNLAVFLLPFVRRKGPLLAHMGKRFYRPPSFPLGFALAGRPTKQQFILVYGEKGPTRVR